MMRRTFWVSLVLMIFPVILHAHEISLGPEFNYVTRIRKGGTKQTGNLYGLRGIYDHIGRYLIYCGVEGAYSTGYLTGKTGGGQRIKSRFTQESIEGRLGYTFQSKDRNLISFTPFLGMGYFVELNHYVSPSEIKVHFDNKFAYAAAGVMLRGCITPNLRFGLNATARWNLNGKMKISHDPQYESCSLDYMQKMQGRVSLPIWYKKAWGTYCIELGINPFYEFRQYGQKSGVPFDFMDTKVKNWGIDLFYTYSF